ncbi:MAG: hypothetical protein AAF481_16415 [Acidobacteriota bacterium]
MNELCRLLLREVSGARSVAIIDPSAKSILARAEIGGTTEDMVALVLNLQRKIQESPLPRFLRQELGGRSGRSEVLRRLLVEVDRYRLFIRSIRGGQQLLAMMAGESVEADEVWGQIEQTTSLVVTLSESGWPTAADGSGSAFDEDDPSDFDSLSEWLEPIR